MTIQEAIAKAIEGGYKGGHIWNVKGDFYVLRNENGNGYEHLSIYEMLLDSHFWQCLGKSMGWKDGEKIVSFGRGNYIKEWLYQQHRLIDHIAEGGTIESYFENL